MCRPFACSVFTTAYNSDAHCPDLEMEVCVLSIGGLAGSRHALQALTPSPIPSLGLYPCDPLRPYFSIIYILASLFTDGDEGGDWITGTLQGSGTLRPCQGAQEGGCMNMGKSGVGELPKLAPLETSSWDPTPPSIPGWFTFSASSTPRAPGGCWGHPEREDGPPPNDCVYLGRQQDKQKPPNPWSSIRGGKNGRDALQGRGLVKAGLPTWEKVGRLGLEGCPKGGSPPSCISPQRVTLLTSD